MCIARVTALGQELESRVLRPRSTANKWTTKKVNNIFSKSYKDSVANTDDDDNDDSNDHEDDDTADDDNDDND